MKIYELKNILKEIHSVVFELPNGSLVPKHFHITEIGKITKKFIDCGSSIRFYEFASFQLWSSSDIDHRMDSKKLISIINTSEKILDLNNLDIEIEYQYKDTIGKFGLEFNGSNFVLTPLKTDCLAKQKCSPKTQDLESNSNCC